MTQSETTQKKSLWLSIEEKFLALDSADYSEANKEASIQKIAGELDDAGYNISKHGGNLLKLRWAMDEMRQAGRPLMKDFNAAVDGFALEDLADPYATVNSLIDEIGNTWPKFKSADRRPDVIKIIEKKKLDLQVAKAKSLSGDKGIRYLIEEKVASETIISTMEITAEKLKEVNAAIEKERAEIARVESLLAKVEGKSDEEKVKHLLENDVAENLILEVAKLDQAAIDGAKAAMEADLKEKQRLEEEEKARKKAEAAGPALEDIAPDDMLDHIEAIREIMEFSDKENEIRTMCEQSAIPAALVDIAISDPDKLDELEKQAEG